ncbi:MAG: TlpA disulfide reductase family protein [Myxococcota bacterium]
MRGAGWTPALALLFAACASKTPDIPEGPPVALKLRRIDGNTLNIGALRGKVVVITVLTSFARDALAELPRLEALRKHHGPELEVIAILLEEHPDVIRAFAVTFPVRFVVAVPDDLTGFVGSRGPLGPILTLPTSVVLDQAGIIRARSEGQWPPEFLEPLVDRLLAADHRSH